MKTRMKNQWLLTALAAGLCWMLPARLTGQTFTTLHSFSPVSAFEGQDPQAGLIMSGNTLYGTTEGGGASYSGQNSTVFKVNADGTGFATLHIFNNSGNDGIDPQAGLILSGSILYGTASGGGSGGSGTVFALATNGTSYGTLYSFSATDTNGFNSDGSGPAAGLILSGNTLYGTTASGGSTGNGTVFKVNTDGSGFSNLYNFPASDTSGGQTPQAGLILSGNTLYGTTVGGGRAGMGTVFKINTNGSGFTTLYSFSATDTNGFNSDGAAPQAGLILSGNMLYGTAHAGGTAGNGTIFAVATNGSGFATLYSFTGGNDGASPQAGLILSGNTLYGTANGGGSAGDGTLFAVKTNGTDFAPLYSFSATDINGFNTDGANPQAGLILSGNTLSGTAYGGGSAGCGTVFAVSTDGTGFTTLLSFPQPSANSDGTLPGGLIISGNSLYGMATGGGSAADGTVFAVNTDGTGFATLHNFHLGDGINPQAGLILSGNTLYGTASAGGPGSGTVFALQTNGTGFTNFYNFAGGSGGQAPQDGLILSGNTLYGTTYAGGISNNGTVFKVNTDGTGFTNLYSFSATDTNGFNHDGAEPFAGLILSGNTLYGTAYQGGRSGDGTIFAVTTNGTGFTNLYSFTNGSDGGRPFAGLILSGNTLYGTASAGGRGYSGTIFAIATNGTGFTTLYSFTGGSDGASPDAGLIVSGNTLYGTASGGGSAGNGTVFKVNTDGSGFSTLYSFSATDTNGFNGDGAEPYDDLVLSGNTLYGAAIAGGSAGNGTVFSLNLTPPAITTQPAAVVSVLQGQALSLQVGATGGGLTYQWVANNTNLADGGAIYGSATSSLVITPVFTYNSGSYRVIVSNAVGSVTSAVSVVTVQPGTLGQQYTNGINYLTQTNIASALASFTGAVAASPTDPDANVYLALTRLLALPNQPAASNFLNQLGIPAAGRNDYHWTAEPPETTNSNHRRELVIPNVDADIFMAELRNDILPAMIASESNLAQITDTNFGMFLPGSVTHFADVTIDYGDVQMCRAILDAATLFGYTLNTWNLDAQMQAVSNLVETDKSLEAILNAYPNLLAVTNAGDQVLAGGAFTNAINRYFAASQFIRSRRAGVRFFNLVTNDLNDEQNFRAFLTDLESSVSAPFGGPGASAGAISNAAFYGAISGFTNHTLSLSNFFNGKFNVRSLLPAFSIDAFIWDSFPDTTLGGVITGLTETNLGSFFVKKHNFQAQLQSPGVSYTVLSSPSNDLDAGWFNGVVQGQGGNFYGTTPFGGANGDGSFFSVSASGAFTLLYSFGTITNADGNPVDGGQPSGLVLGSDNNLYGSTQWGGDYGVGTIFRITPGGQLTTLYEFGQDADLGSIGGIPLVLGKDGNLYGATPYSQNDDSSGIIFQFIPTATGGQFTTLSSFPTNISHFDASGAGALIQGSDGYFYGVTQNGGTNGGGSIFQFIPGKGGQIKTLHSFPYLNALDAYGNPLMTGVNTLVQGRDGVLYGTTVFGGNDLYNANPNADYIGGGDGTLFSLTTNGAFTQLCLFDHNQFDGFNPNGALVEGTPGVFYGMTVGGGANGYGTIFKFTPGGAPDFVVWFNKNLGEYQENGPYVPLYNYYYYPSVSMGMVAGTGGFYGTTSQGGTNKDGTVFTLNVSSAPSIAISPASTSNLLGSTVVLTVTASGSAPLAYQWGMVGAALPANATGATTDELTVTGLTFADGGSYFVVVTNTYGSATSAVAVLTVMAPPAIVSQPAASVGILQGQALSLQVGATGGGLAFQWFANNVNLTDGGNVFGSATGNLVITPAFTSNSGSYSVIVSNPFGSVTSAVSAVTVLAGTVGQQYSAGTNYLTQTNISQALASFLAAASATNDDENVYLALTRLLALPYQPAGSNFLNRLNFTAAGRNDYDWTAKPETNSKGKLVVAANLDADEFTAELRTNVLPALIASETNLAQITDTNFGMFLPGSVTHFADVTIDYGDVQMMRALLDAATFFGYTLHSWNLDAQFGAVSNLISNNKSLTVQTMMNDYPNLLTVANPGDQALAGGAFTNAINRYFAASQFIRSRRAGVRLFNMVTNDLPDEQNFRIFLSDLESSMSAPFGGPGANAGAIPGAAFYNVLNDLTSNTVSMAAFFNGKFNVRSLLPVITNDAFIWDSFTNTTLDGVITGLTETNLGNVFLKHLKAQLNLPGVAFTVVGSPTNNLQNSLNGVVYNPSDKNLYGTTQYGGENGSGAFFKLTQSGVFTLLYSGTTATNSPDGSDDASTLVAGRDGNLYGTTAFSDLYPNGTIFMLTPAGKLTGLFKFGQAAGPDEGANGGNPLIQGADGNFYGTTPSGGGNNAGIIFEFIPNGSGGSFINLFSFPAVQDQYGNQFPVGAGALIQGKDGYFYGVTQYGGDNGAGSVFQFIPANGGQLNTLYSFDPAFDEFGDTIAAGASTLVQGSNGTLYCATEFGGDNGAGAIISITTNGFATPLYSFDQNQFDGYNPIGAMVQGTNGAFYGITASGGANGDGTIFKFTPGGATGFLVWFDKGLGEQQSAQNSYNGMSYYPPVYAGLTKGAGLFYGTAPNGGLNGNGTVFSLTANDAASIVTSPASTTGLLGYNVTLTVTASGAAPLTYKWVKVGGTTLPSNVSGTTSASLTFTALTALDAGSYYAVASNAYGSSTSDVAVLTVETPPAISTQPAASVNIPQLAELSLTVVAGGPGPYTYQWWANGLALANGGNISGSATSTLVINPAYANNSGSYSVIVSNPYGSVTSQVSVVTVGAGPVILVSPASTTNLAGSNAVFTVSASGTAPLHYQWTKNGTAASNNVAGANANGLKLVNLALANAGSYYVVVTNTYGSATSAVAVLTVVTPPTIAIQPKTPVNISTNVELSLTVGAGGTGPFTYQWRDDGVNLTDGPNILGSATSNLVIYPTFGSNSGSYSVIVSNLYASVTSMVSVVTVGVGPAIVTSPASTNGLVGSNVTLTVSASGTAPLHYQWSKNGTAASNNVAGATTNTLKLANLALANAGSYWVVVTNTYGSATSTMAVLTVVAPPIIATQPKTPVSIVQGAELSLTVVAGGTPPLTYQWLVNGVHLTNAVNISGFANSNLVINPASTANSGSYLVVITNAYAAVTSAVSAVTVAVDRNAPNVTITSPASGARSNAPMTFSGKTWETNVLITNVNYWITNWNGTPLVQSQAVLTAGPGSLSNWTVTVSPPAGSNTFVVQSQDFSGNTSQVVSVKFFLKSPVALALITNSGTGGGKVMVTSFLSGETVSANNPMLNVGEAYAITATPDANSLFDGWTGNAGTTNGLTLDFIMQSNTSLTANFVTNIFLGMAGTYNGLFSVQAANPTVETAGLIGNLALRTNGGYSATVYLAGSAPGLAGGTFAPVGSVTTNVTTALDGKVTVQLTVNAGSAPRTITGWVTGTNTITVNGTNQSGWTSGVTLVAGLTNSSLDAGRYTLLIPPAPQQSVPANPAPPGYGYALLTNNPGTATVLPSISIGGVLADGAAFSQGVQIGEDNMIPVYANPYSTNVPGLLFGWLNLSNTPAVAAPSGELTWIRKESASGLFNAGFTNLLVAAQGSPWLNSAPITSVIPPGSLLTLSNGNLTVPLTFDVSLNNTNLVLTPTPAGANYSGSGSINTNSGQLTITVTNAAVVSKVILAGHGAVLQDSGSGGGFFLVPAANPTNAGTFELVPPYVPPANGD